MEKLLRLQYNLSTTTATAVQRQRREEEKNRRKNKKKATALKVLHVIIWVLNKTQQYTRVTSEAEAIKQHCNESSNKWYEETQNGFYFFHSF